MRETNHAVIGCSFVSVEAATAAIRDLRDRGLADVWRVGAADDARARSVADAAGASAGLDASDPLRGVPGLATKEGAARSIDLGALGGALIGATAGYLGGSSPLGAIMPVSASERAIASALLFFAVGAAVGGVLGGALGARASTHAGFRLIDAMEAGHLVAVGRIDGARLDDARAALENAGAADIVVIDVRP